MHLVKGCYTCDICSTYWEVIPKYRGEDYTKAKIIHYNENGILLAHAKNFKLYHKNITHWKRYSLFKKDVDN